MIAHLRGVLASVAAGEVVVDVAGVGYRVLVPAGRPIGAAGERVLVHTHLAVREDQHTLYGFADAETRRLFETLLGVSKVGPKLALAAVGTLGAAGLRRAVLEQDVDALTVVPGVGRKGAQRLILELRERLGADDLATVPGDGDAGGDPADARVEVRRALTALGYAAAEVREAMAGVPDDDGDPDAAELLRTALRALGRR